jgi:hypothetical protein
MQVDYMNLLQAIRNGANPQQLVMSVLEGQMASTPMGKNLLQLVKENKTSEIEKIARNICVQHGIDFDKEFASFK